MGLPTAAIMTAAILRYRADITLRGLLVGSTAPTWNIFDADGMPVNQPFPYVVISIPVEQSGAGLVMGTDGVDSYLYASTFTQTGASGGCAQARGIAAQLYYLTHPKPFDLEASGFSQFFCLFQDKHEVPQQDGITQMIVQRFKLMTQG